MRLYTVPVKAKPKEGDQMQKKKFAWWPKKVEDKMIWLEHYIVTYRFVIRDRLHDLRQFGVIRVHGGGWDLINEQLIDK
jgi:hypothetical protein